jgi:hypothetical protein
MSYERDLTFALRLRGMTDAQIAKALAEAREHVKTSKSSMEDQFGTAADFASQFPRRKRASLGRKVVTFSTIVALVYGVFSLAAGPVFSIDLSGLGPVTLWPALLLAFGGVIGGFLLDYLKPVRVADGTDPFAG